MRGEDIPQDIPFICIVQSTSPRHVLKQYGGIKKHIDAGKVIHLQFPTQQKEIHVFPKQWEPQDDANFAETPLGFIKIIPVTRYLCECGEERLSEHRYPSVWCTCEKKMFPVDKELPVFHPIPHPK